MQRAMDFDFDRPGWTDVQDAAAAIGKKIIKVNLALLFPELMERFGSALEDHPSLRAYSIIAQGFFNIHFSQLVDLNNRIDKFAARLEAGKKSKSKRRRAPEAPAPLRCPDFEAAWNDLSDITLMTTEFLEDEPLYEPENIYFPPDEVVASFLPESFEGISEDMDWGIDFLNLEPQEPVVMEEEEKSIEEEVLDNAIRARNSRRQFLGEILDYEGGSRMDLDQLLSSCENHVRDAMNDDEIQFDLSSPLFEYYVDPYFQKPPSGNQNGRPGDKLSRPDEVISPVHRVKLESDCPEEEVPVPHADDTIAVRVKEESDCPEEGLPVPHEDDTIAVRVKEESDRPEEGLPVPHEDDTIVVRVKEEITEEDGGPDAAQQDLAQQQDRPRNHLKRYRNVGPEPYRPRRVRKIDGTQITSGEDFIYWVDFDKEIEKDDGLKLSEPYLHWEAEGNADEHRSEPSFGSLNVNVGTDFLEQMHVLSEQFNAVWQETLDETAETDCSTMFDGCLGNGMTPDFQTARERFNELEEDHHPEADDNNHRNPLGQEAAESIEGGCDFVGNPLYNEPHSPSHSLNGIAPMDVDTDGYSECAEAPATGENLVICEGSDEKDISWNDPDCAGTMNMDERLKKFNSFKEAMSSNHDKGRGEVTEFFIFLLKRADEGLIRIQQDEPYGDIKWAWNTSENLLTIDLGDNMNAMPESPNTNSMTQKSNKYDIDGDDANAMPEAMPSIERDDVKMGQKSAQGSKSDDDSDNEDGDNHGDDDGDDDNHDDNHGGNHGDDDGARTKG